MALLDRLKSDGAVAIEGAIVSFGDPVGELERLRTGVAVIPALESGFLEVGGRDRIRLLQGLSTNDLYRLISGREGATYGKSERPDFSTTPEGPGQMTAFPNRQGKMIAAGVARLLTTTALIQVHGPAEPLRAHVAASIIMDRAEARDATADWAHFVLAGPGAAAIAPETSSLADFHMAARRDWRLSPNRRAGIVDVLVPARHAEAAWEILSSQAAPAGGAALETWRIERGWPRWGADLDGSMLPMEGGIEIVAVSYTKGCYLGQEVIQRVKTYSEPPRRLVQLTSQTPLAAGVEVKRGDEVVGRVTSAAGGTGLALLRRESAESGTRVDAGGMGAEVRALPCFMQG